MVGRGAVAWDEMAAVWRSAGAEAGVAFGKRSAQRALASGGERDWSGNRSEAEIGAESPSAKRLAQKLKWA